MVPLNTARKKLTSIWLNITDPLERKPVRVLDTVHPSNPLSEEIFPDGIRMGFYRSGGMGIVKEDGLLPPNPKKVTKVNWRGQLINRLTGDVIIYNWREAQKAMSKAMDVAHRRSQFQVLPGGLDKKL